MAWKPGNADQAAEAVADALSGGVALELIGTATRRSFGRPVEAQAVLDLSGLSGVVAYQPEELVLTLGPATPMAQVLPMLAERSQCLAFEPPDFGPLWGAPEGLGTIGGAIMTGRGGPRRLTAGGPRDHCLGLKGVNGFGEAFGAGGRVVKNVTGFDLPKLAAGSFGTLCAATELTLKVLPSAPETQTLAVRGLGDEAAISAMAKALGSAAQVSAAAHLPSDVARSSKVGEISAAGAAVTLLRVEGVRPSVVERIGRLAELLGGAQALLDREASHAAWKEVGDCSLFAGGDDVIWKLSVAPSEGARIGRALADLLGGRCFYDWGGGGVWLALPFADDAHAQAVRGELTGGGHATLMRAPATVRAAVAPFQPQAAAMAALSERVRRQFDPQGIFNPGRMYA